MSRRGSMTGFTAVELLVTISIVAILGAIAIPAFGDFVVNNRAIGRINEFVTAVNYARSEAVNRGGPVTICSSTSPQASNPVCDGGQQWESGWIVFADYDGDGTMDLGTGSCLTEEDCLLVVADGTDNITLRADQTRITFDSMGGSRGHDGTWTLCGAAGAQKARAAILSASGHIRQAKDSDGDGVPEGSSGNNVTCP